MSRNPSVRNKSFHIIMSDEAPYYFVTYINPSNENRMRSIKVTHENGAIALLDKHYLEEIGEALIITQTAKPGQSFEAAPLKYTGMTIELSPDDVFQKVANRHDDEVPGNPAATRNNEIERYCRDEVKKILNHRNELEIRELLESSADHAHMESQLQFALNRAGLSAEMANAMAHQVEEMKHELATVRAELELQRGGAARSSSGLYMEVNPDPVAAEPLYMDVNPGPETTDVGIQAGPAMTDATTQTEESSIAPVSISTGASEPPKAATASRRRRQLPQAPGATTVPGSVSKAVEQALAERGGGVI